MDIGDEQALQKLLDPIRTEFIELKKIIREYDEINKRQANKIRKLTKEIKTARHLAAKFEGEANDLQKELEAARAEIAMRCRSY